MIVFSSLTGNLLTVTDAIWIYAADELLWHKFKIVGGDFIDVEQQSNPDPNAADFSDRNIGYAIWLLGDDSQYHALAIDITNNFADLEQSVVKPTTQFTRQAARFSNGMHLPSPVDSLFHKFTVTGATFLDAAQGASVPV